MNWLATHNYLACCSTGPNTTSLVYLLLIIKLNCLKYLNGIVFRSVLIYENVQNKSMLLINRTCVGYDRILDCYLLLCHPFSLSLSLTHTHTNSHSLSFSLRLSCFVVSISIPLIRLVCSYFE